MGIDEKREFVAILLTQAGYREVDDGVWLAKSATLTGTVRSAVFLAQAAGFDTRALVS